MTPHAAIDAANAQVMLNTIKTTFFTSLASKLIATLLTFWNRVEGMFLQHDK
jgi:ABC-type sulfate transport system permease component